ncbi:MAG: CHAD domain-containing protein [Chthonomonadales bacterium]
MPRPQPVAGLEPQGSILFNAALIIPVRIAEVLAWEGPALVGATVFELHQMRIAAKRLRYTIEIFAPVLPEESAAAIAVFKVLQDHLGTLHDMDVLIPDMLRHVRDLIKEASMDETGLAMQSADLDSAIGLLSVCKELREERTNRFEEFRKFWSDIREDQFFESLVNAVHRRAVDERARLAVVEAESLVHALQDGPSNAITRALKMGDKDE